MIIWKESKIALGSQLEKNIQVLAHTENLRKALMQE
jgi:hypothetical protein